MPTGVTGTTTKGIPYFDDTLPAAQIGDGIVALTSWLDAHVVQSFTQAQINALAGADLWTGRVVYNSSTAAFQFYNGAAWTNMITSTLQLDTTSADITASAPGDASTAGSIGKAADAGHRHGREAYGLGTDISALTRGAAAAAGASGREADAAHVHSWPDTDTTLDTVHSMRNRIDQRQLVITWTSGLPTQIVEKDSSGATTLKTTTLNWTGSVLTSVTETANGHTVTTTLSYTSGNLTGVTRSYV